MLIKSLSLKNIGPFREARIEFPIEKIDGLYPVTVITGENGAGKSIILDAIRNMLLSPYCDPIRSLVADPNDFLIELETLMDGGDITFSTAQIRDNGRFDVLPKNHPLYRMMCGLDAFTGKWIIDYWSPNQNSGKYTVDSIKAIDTSKPLAGCLYDDFPNLELTKFITSIEYLKSSENQEEKEIGEVTYAIISEIIADCLGEGYALEYVSHKTMDPIVNVKGKRITLDKLSFGNSLMISHFIRLFSRMYAVCVSSKTPINEVKNIPGILLIDEVESHLHPKWQKRVVQLIRKHFKNLQIIITTHSPFVVSSINDPHVYVCQSHIDYSELVDVSSDYSNLPIDEVLITPVFAVDPFSEDISKLLAERKQLFKNGDLEGVANIEARLVSLNANTFGFLK